MKRLRLAASAAAIGLTAFGGHAIAQDAGSPPPEAPPVATPAPATPAPATPPASTTQSPPAAATTTTAPPAATTATPPAAGTGQQLPEVKIIQEQPKPTPAPEPVQEAAPKPKPKKKPAPVAEAPPAPKPVKKAVAQPQPAPEPVAVQPQAPAVVTSTVGPPAGDTAVKMSPLSGSEIPLDKVPGAVGIATSEQISTEGSGQVQQTLQQQVPGVVLTDIGGSGFRTDVSYRGFDASPIGGRAQGLAVYQNGVRINEAFGDTVNLDIIPSNAISDIAIVGGNPVFGLNAIGGALSMTMKDGFSFTGGEIDLMAGSFGRKQVGVQAGGNSGGVAAYFAGQYVEEDGFRDFSAAEVKRMYGDIAFKGDRSEFHLSLTAGDSVAGVVSAAPVDVLAVEWGRTFTSPQDTSVEVLMPTVSGRVDVTETLSFSGVAYYRRLKQRVIDGNLSEAAPCEPGEGPAGILCADGDPLESATGLIPVPAGVIGSIERINTDADSYGVSLQAVDKSQLFGRSNQFLVGVSYDHGQVSYRTSSEVGTIGERFVVTGTGQIVNEPSDLAPRDLESENKYYGIYFSNTLDVTDQLAVTVGGRYNYATIELTELTGRPEFAGLNADTQFERFNPTVGATYKLLPGLSLYGNYSEANRAPTAAELGCAEESNPCFIESFLTDDPPLNQVVTRSVEAGIRGESKSYNGDRFSWSLGYFRSVNSDDILNVASQTFVGRGYFLNAGDTKREGFEAAAGFQTDRLKVYGSYAYINATFEDSIILPAPNTPDAEPCPGTVAADDINCNFVSPGDNLPGIPKHRFKAGIAYWMTPEWKIGADLVAASNQVFFGDEANNNAKLDGYTRVDLNTSYDINEHVQVYGLIKNVFDRRYGLYGTFFDTEESEEAFDAAGYAQSEDPRSITPSLPFAAYGGVKIKF
ncbi:MAG: TonB-dependent receptor [Hyphomicrobium sp.]